MRRAVWAIISLLAAGTVLVACGGYSGTNTPITSGVTNRVFASNTFSGAIDIINATRDSLDTHRIITDAGPKYMALSPDKTGTMLFTSGTNRLVVISNKSESVAGSLQLQSAIAAPQGFLILSDNKTIYAAARNAGVVTKWDTGAGSTLGITVPNPMRIVRSNNSKYVLAFPDDNSDTVYFIDTTATTPTAVAVTGFDRPVYAVFSSDDSFAYVVNCGPQCGGTQAGIQILNTPAHTLGASLNLAAADFALLDGSTLYVAGTPPATPCTAAPAINCGVLSLVNASATPTFANSFQISDGYHDHMLKAPNNRLYIGAEYTCAAIAPNGCLSIFNTSSSTVVIVPPCASACNELNDISGMTNVSGRTVVYVVEGGEIHVYDTATDAQKPGVSIDTIGRSWDVVNPD